jgi:hypothetical protein
VGTPAVQAAPVATPASTMVQPSGCKKATFTADGGYYSAGNFYWEPEDTVTVIAAWCYASGRVTSFSPRHTTTIGASAKLRLTVQTTPAPNGSSVTIFLSGDYLSGILNNIGFIGIEGDVGAYGHHHFVNVANSGG